MEMKTNLNSAMVSKRLRIAMLLDVYGKLLTEKQKLFIELHYEHDLSFGEIAQENGVTRQAVYDSVKHAKNILENYEKNLSLLEMRESLNDNGETGENYSGLTEKLKDLRAEIQKYSVIQDTEWVVKRIDEIMAMLRY